MEIEQATQCFCNTTAEVLEEQAPNWTTSNADPNNEAS